MAGARPPRWLKCPRKSSIIADRFIAFKTFLDEKFDNQVPLEDQFKFPMLKSYIEGNKKELGLIIDLTNTKRFYNKAILDKSGVHHYKLACRGRGETPNEDQTKTFIRTCDSFFRDHPEKVIGVHCTHGFNRTGFLIISYLCEVEDWGVEAALDLFAKCRPPGIYKGDYIKELFLRYEGSSETAPPAPELPDWCFEEEEGEDDEEGFQQHTAESFSDKPRPSKRKKRMYNENAKFAEDIDMELVGARGAERVQQICEEMCGWDRGNFPGSQPVSMDRQNISYLASKPYKVSWKADGTRYMMLILKEGEVYFLDRDNSVFTTEKFIFPRRKNAEEYLFDTLVDGELVLDKVGDKTHPRYLIYDIVKFEGVDVGKTDLDRRLLCVEKEIVQPRNAATQAGRIDKTKEPFSIRKKDFFPVEQASWVLDHFSQKVTHETDGLIFQPLIDEYIPGTCPFSLKWKPHDLNSVDFLLKISKENKIGCLPELVGNLFVQGMDVPFSRIKVNAELKHYDKRIIECTWNNSSWKFLRLREDKSFPNAYRTAQNVCESIRHPITKEGLIEFIRNHAFRPHGK